MYLGCTAFRATEGVNFADPILKTFRINKEGFTFSVQKYS